MALYVFSYGAITPELDTLFNFFVIQQLNQEMVL